MAKCRFCSKRAYYKKSGICKACYSAFYYWKEKTVTQMIKRVDRLHVYEARMQAMLGNIKTLKGRRKAS